MPRALGCDAVRGFPRAAPMDAAALRRWLHERARGSKVRPDACRAVPGRALPRRRRAYRSGPIVAATSGSDASSFSRSFSARHAR
jgi:hypothetical protein